MGVIEKKEALFAAAGAALILGWFLFLRDLIAPFLSSIHPFIAMMLYNVGLLVGIYLLSSLLKTKREKGDSMHVKLTFIIFTIILGINILTAPYLVDKAGVINAGVDYWYVGADAGFGSLYSSMLPEATWMGINNVWLLTYIITPILLICLIPILIANPKMIKHAIG